MLFVPRVLSPVMMHLVKKQGRMRIARVVFSFLTVGAMVGVVLADPVITNSPRPARLTEAQMDAVTAGEVLVSVDALAVARGPHTNTRADTQTTALAGRLVDVGIGVGTAIACCGALSATDVSTSASAEGGQTVISSERNHGSDTPLYSYKAGTAVIVSVKHPEGFH